MSEDKHLLRQMYFYAPGELEPEYRKLFDQKTMIEADCELIRGMFGQVRAILTKHRPFEDEVTAKQKKPRLKRNSS